MLAQRVRLAHPVDADHGAEAAGSGDFWEVRSTGAGEDTTSEIRFQIP